jgi:hypothetical protein
MKPLNESEEAIDSLPNTLTQVPAILVEANIDKRLPNLENIRIEKLE